MREEGTTIPKLAGSPVKCAHALHMREEGTITPKLAGSPVKCAHHV